MDAAQRYEGWFETPFGRRADRVEKCILAGLLGDFCRPSTLLDVGCGTGHLAGFWAEQGLSAVGLDIDAARLKFARLRWPDVPVVLGDALDLPFRDGSFDIVALVTVLEFVSAPEKALREAARVARQGILLGALSSVSPVAWWRRARRARAYRGARFFSPWGLERLARRSLSDRAVAIRTKTGLYPLPWIDACARLPLGAFIGMSVRFA